MTLNVLIIGTGVSGLSAAWALVQRGYRVTLLEKGSVGTESSWAGGGILSPLLPWDYAAPVSALCLHAMAAYPEWIARLEASSQLDTEYWQCGMHVHDAGMSDAALAWCVEHNFPYHSFASSLPEGPTLCLPSIAQIRNPRLLSALLKAVQTSGGQVIEHAPLTSVLEKYGKAIAAVTPTGTYPADQIVIATGAWAGLALDGLTPVTTIRPIRGQMLLFKLAPGELDTIVYRNGLYLIPRRDGHVLVGSSLEDVGFDKSIDSATRQRLHSEAAELLPALGTLQPVRHWAGLRPGSPDNIPVIGRHPDFDNVFVDTGQYRYGVTMAPACAELLVDLMEDKTPVLDPAPYSWQAARLRHW